MPWSTATSDPATDRDASNLINTQFGKANSCFRWYAFSIYFIYYHQVSKQINKQV